MASSSSVSSSERLALYRNTIAALSFGKEANEEAWMTMWCSSNWAELLQPAPLSIALLGSVLCIASGTNDFSVYRAVTGDLVQALTMFGAQVSLLNHRKAYLSSSGSMSSTQTHSKRASCRFESFSTL